MSDFVRLVPPAPAPPPAPPADDSLLPPASWRRRLKGVLRKYHHESGLGWVKISEEVAKVIPDDHRALMKKDPGLTSFLHPAQLERRLQYWCDENGDLKTPPKYAAILLKYVEYFLNKVCAAEMARFSKLGRFRSLADGLSSFLTIPPGNRQFAVSNYGIIPAGLYRLQPKFGKYAGIDQNKSTLFIYFKQADHPDALVVHSAIVPPVTSTASILQRMGGVYLPFSFPPCIVLREIISQRNNVMWVSSSQGEWTAILQEPFLDRGEDSTIVDYFLQPMIIPHVEELFTSMDWEV